MTGASTLSRDRVGLASGRLSRRLTGVLRFGFVALLLVTGALKLVDFPGFTAVVASYRVVPEPLVGVAALGVAVAELGIGLWLAAGLRLKASVRAVILLHLGYLAWLGTALLRGLALPNCGCFGVYWPRPLSPTMLLEDGLLLALALALHLGVSRDGAR